MLTQNIFILLTVARIADTLWVTSPFHCWPRPGTFSMCWIHGVEEHLLHMWAMQYPQQAWAALLVKPCMARWERHTPCCWRGQVEVRPCKHWESCGKSKSTVVQKGAGHKSTGNQAISLALLFIELCVSLRSAPDLELVSLHWLRYSSQGGQPEFTCTTTSTCTYQDLHNTGV